MLFLYSIGFRISVFGGFLRCLNLVAFLARFSIYTKLELGLSALAWPKFKKMKKKIN